MFEDKKDRTEVAVATWKQLVQPNATNCESCDEGDPGERDACREANKCK